jgi:hypothetical protein
VYSCFLAQFASGSCSLPRVSLRVLAEPNSVLIPPGISENYQN